MCNGFADAVDAKREQNIENIKERGPMRSISANSPSRSNFAPAHVVRIPGRRRADVACVPTVE